MTERTSEKAFATDIFGRNHDANNIGRKAAATIYHSIFLHNPVKDLKLLAGIKNNLSKLLTPEEFKLIEKAHSELDEHNLK